MITLKNLTKCFRQKTAQRITAVNNVSLHVPAGEICVLIGPSGCGKTTTLKLINRLITPDQGKIIINGEDTTTLDSVTLRRNIGYVIQQIGLFPNMTIEQNISLVPRMLHWDQARCKTRAMQLMEMVALDYRLLQCYPRQLSGGQQQRVGVIRALAADPPVLLMDEPFGAVDPINREAIQNQFLEMQQKLRKTVLLVSHDIDEALKLGDRIAVFRSGKIEQYASPDELLAKPASEFVAAFVGEDRTLKRLLLVQAGDVTEKQIPLTVHCSTPLAQAFALMDDNDMRFITVVDTSDRPLGFVKRREARNASGNCGEKLHSFPATGKAEDNLRVVLSKLYQHGSVSMPIVDEQGRYQGEISQDDIAHYLSSGQTRRILQQ